MLKKGLYSGFALIIINKHLYIFHDKYRVTHHHYTIHTDTEVYISQSTFTYFLLNHLKIQIWHLRESIQSLMQWEQSEVVRIRRGLTNCFCPQAKISEWNWACQNSLKAFVIIMNKRTHCLFVRFWFQCPKNWISLVLRDLFEFEFYFAFLAPSGAQ